MSTIWVDDVEMPIAFFFFGGIFSKRIITLNGPHCDPVGVVRTRSTEARRMQECAAGRVDFRKPCMEAPLSLFWVA
jgi:hypothetical protein